MAFDENKYKKIFEQRFGSDSYESGLSNARKIGQLQAQAEIAKKRYNDSFNEYGVKKKGYNDAIEYWKNADLGGKTPYQIEQEIRNDPNAEQRIKDEGYSSIDDFVDGLYAGTSGGKYRSAREYNQHIEEQNKREAKEGEKRKKQVQNRDKLYEEEFGITYKEFLKQQQENAKKEVSEPSEKKTSTKKAEKKDTNFLGKAKDFFTGKDTDGDGDRDGILGFVDRYIVPVSKGMTDSFMPGNTEKMAKIRPDNPVVKAAQKDRGLETDILNTTGVVAGFMAPYGKAYNVANATVSKIPQLAKIANPFAKRAIKGGIAGGIAETGIAGINELANPDAKNIKDYGKQIGLGVAGGAIGDPALYGLGRVVNKGFQTATNKAMQNMLPTNQQSANSFANILKDAERLNVPKQEPSLDNLKALGERRPQLNSNLPKNPFEAIEPQENIKYGGKLKQVSEPKFPGQEEQIVLSQDKKPIDLKRKLSVLYQNTFDSQNLLGKISNDTKVKASNSRQTQGVVDYIAEQGLVDKEGRKIGESLTELVQGLPLEKESDFWRYMGHRHNVARAKEGKNVFSQFDSDLSKTEAEKLLSQNPEFKEVGEKVTNWINTFMDTWAKDLVGEDTLKLWKEMYPNYFPIYRDMDPLKQISFNGAKRGFVNQHNLVKKAKGAKSDLSSNIKDPTSNILQLVNKTIKAEKNNQVGKAIVDEVKKGHLDDLFEIISMKQGSVHNKALQEDGLEGVMDQLTVQFDDVFKQIEKGNNIVKVMDNGKVVLLKVKDIDYLKALQSLSDGTGKSAAEQFESAARKVARPIKDLITSKNPLFAIFNVMRDTPTAFIQGQENNIFKFSTRYMRALNEITHNSKGYQEFVAQGGAQSGFFQNDVFKTATKLKNSKLSPLEKFIGKIELFNNLTESTPRYMEYLATLEKGGTREQAIYNAAEVTTNFARNGKWGKFFDSFILYLNPALQGLDKFVRQMKSKPISTALKAGGVITVPQAITDVYNNDNPNYHTLDQRVKDDFFLIPNKFGPQDEQGYAETFFRIPKARQYSVVFAVLTNRLGEVIFNDKSIKDASKGVMGSIDRNFSVPTRPIWSPFSDVARNKDWKNAPINPMGMELDNRSNYLKYDEKTSEIGKLLAKMLNEQPIEGIKYSPKDIDYLIDSYTGIIGDMVLPAATESEGLSGIPKKKFIADSVYSNQAVTDFYDNLQKMRTKASDRNVIEDISGGIQTREERQRNQLDKISEDMGNLNKRIKATQDEAKQRELRERLNTLAIQGNNFYKKYQR